KAAEQGYAKAQYNLALCYVYGNGVIQDYKKAKYWWEKAAEQGLAEARDMLKRLEEESLDEDSEI
ncbi:MAG: SEL1-like repeat protein, partial [Bacteroidales bacterium]|nr:SEL1-like repeat protein [Bacteroidales bacterium]